MSSKLREKSETKVDYSPIYTIAAQFFTISSSVGSVFPSALSLCKLSETKDGSAIPSSCK